MRRLLAAIFLTTSIAIAAPLAHEAQALPAGLPNQPIVGIAATPSGNGYWLVARDGGIFTFGNARYFGSTGNRHLNQPIVGIAATPSGKGYWLVARDGGIFTFGDARYFGSMGGRHLNQPIVGIAATPSGKGYRLAGADGGIFTFGRARYFGSAAGWPLTQAIVSFSATRSGQGYLLASADGAVLAFGDAQHPGRTDVVNAGAYVGIAAAPTGSWMVSEFGNVVGKGRASLGGVFRDVRHITRTITYTVGTVGNVSGVSTFASMAAFTLNDPRGWSQQGTRYVQVPSGGNFRLLLTEAARVPSFGSPCSSMWSCRQGGNVVVNNDRWRFASPSWNAAHGALRDYRHMVVNHEVGHWLGRGHLFCSRRGSLAPVMQQQSINLQGCAFNAWPLASEL